MVASPGGAQFRANGGHPHAEGAPEYFNDADAPSAPEALSGPGAASSADNDVQALLAEIAQLKADMDQLKAKVGPVDPINFTGPGVTGPATWQVKPQKVI